VLAIPLFVVYCSFWVVDELDHVLKYIAVYIGSEKGNMATPQQRTK